MIDTTRETPKEEGKALKLRLEFKPQDFWIGVFWKSIYAKTDEGPKRAQADIWICILPMLPIHVTVKYRLRIAFRPEAQP